MTEFSTIDNPVWSVDTTADRLLEAVARSTGGAIDPIGTGWRTLDSVLDGGLRPEDLVVLGGKPGVGKTIALLQWARASAEACRPVAYVSFEHSAQSLLRRLLVAEIAAVSRGRLDGTTAVLLRRAVRDHMDGQIDLDALRATSPFVDEAYERLRTDGPFLSLERGAPRDAGLAGLAALVEAKLAPGGLLIIDYLQKVGGVGSASGEDRVVEVASQLKSLAMERGIVVLVASAVNDDAMTTRRLGMAGLRGSAGLAHEADVAMMMNEKASIVSRRHGAYDLTLLDRYATQTVFTVEKNREGPSPVHLQFTKDFANYRFEAPGSFVAERLVGDELVDE